MTDDIDNVVQLAPIRAAREESEDEEGTEFDASTLCWVVDEGEASFVALKTTWAPVDGTDKVDAESFVPEEAEALALALIRAAGRVRELRGESE